MADEADLAFHAEQTHLAEALAAQRQHGPGLIPTGSCHYCGRADTVDRLFCDTDCAADWEYQDALRQKLGLSRGRALPSSARRTLSLRR